MGPFWPPPILNRVKDLSILLIDLSWLLDKNLWCQTNLCFCLFPMFLNYSLISLVYFRWFTLTKFIWLVFILFNMDLLILPSSVLSGFNFGLVSDLWDCWNLLKPFKMIKHLFLPFIKIWLTASLFSIVFFSSSLTFLLVLPGVFCVNYFFFVNDSVTCCFNHVEINLFF